MAILIEHRVGSAGFIRLEYNENNLRINRFSWSIPAGRVGALLFDGFTLELTGEDKRNVPAALVKDLELREDKFGDVTLQLPEGTTWRFENRSA